MQSELIIVRNRSSDLIGFICRIRIENRISRDDQDESPSIDSDPRERISIQLNERREEGDYIATCPTVHHALSAKMKI